MKKERELKREDREVVEKCVACVFSKDSFEMRSFGCLEGN